MMLFLTSCIFAQRVVDVVEKNENAKLIEDYEVLFSDSNILHGNDNEYYPKTKTTAEVIDADSFNKWEGYQKIHLFGDGADKFEEDFNEDNRVVVHKGFYPSAQFMTSLSDKKFKNKYFEDVAYFEPFYLKEFIAIKPRNLF